jgi:hypothetical protein
MAILRSNTAQDAVLKIFFPGRKSQVGQSEWKSNFGEARINIPISRTDPFLTLLIGVHQRSKLWRSAAALAG